MGVNRCNYCYTYMFRAAARTCMRGMRFAGLAALVFAFPLLAVTLVTNLALVPASGGGSSYITVGAGITGNSIAVMPSAVNGPSALELVALAAILASATAVGAWRLNKRRRRDEYYWHREQPKISPYVSLALLAVGIVSIYGLFLLAEEGQTLLTGGQTTSLPSGLPYLAPLAVAAGSVVALLVSVSAYRSARIASRERPDAPLDREEVSRILGDAADQLHLSSDYRSAILRCYVAICEVLDRDGTGENSSLTAREFESQMATRLGISSPYLHEATLLFEKARYSTAVIREEDCNQSRLCLHKLSEQITAPRV